MKTVLIVDDSAFMRKVMKGIVVKNGYEVVSEAKSGVEAVAEFKKHKPDIITMDVVMNEMDGLSALKTIIKINHNANVIMVSSMGQDVIVREAIVEGAKNFILKPFTEQQVITAFEKLGTSPIK